MDQWLSWAKELQAIAQAGLEYTKDKYDRERFRRIREISLEIVQEYSKEDMRVIRDLFANESGYQTPKVDVRGAIFKENRILMVREEIDGKWSLPGGWADIDLSIRENVVKEAFEEAGAKVLPKRIIAILDRRKHNSEPCPYSIYKVFVECDFLEGDYLENIETIAAGFFDLDHLPELSLTRNTYEQIRMCFETHNQARTETIFD
ncbi:MAG: NUDIX hydrolase [Vallitaleaceae bacterium]|nr:NUDIX hydrolase [Vallitaleaceae bacterium]